MKKYYIGDHIEIADETMKIGEGGEANIYPINKTVAVKDIRKVYRNQKQAKIEALVQHQSLFEESVLKDKFSYPLEIAREFEDSSFCGFSMQLFVQCKNFKEIHFNLLDGTFKRVDLDDNQAFSIARQLFSDLALIHQYKMIVGDLNPKNILVSSKNEVYWVDVDSYGIPGHPTRVEGMQGYVCPNVLANDKDMNGNYSHNAGSDLYALAIVCFEFLVGCHPYFVPCTTLSDTAAIRENISFFSFIEGNGRSGKHHAVLGNEYQKVKARLLDIRQKAPDLYSKLFDILYLGKRSFASVKEKTRPRTKRPSHTKPVRILRTPQSLKKPDPPELALFLKRYNIIWP